MENNNLKSNTLLYTSIIIILSVIIIIIYIIFKLYNSNTNSTTNIIPNDNNSTNIIPSDNNSTNIIPSDNNSNDITPTDITPTDITPTENNSNDITPIDNNSNDITPTDNNSTNIIPTDNNSSDNTSNIDNTLISLTFPKSTTNWKQVCYIGNTMTANAFNNFIDIANKAGITHIIIHFIVCDLKNNNLTYNDTVNSWQNYTSAEKLSLVNKMNNYNIILMASFGGDTSFINGFNEIFDSPDYKNSENLANDLIEWMIINKIYGIDIDIGKNNDITDTYIPYRDKIANYLGFLSQQIKIMGQKLGFYIHISHAILPRFIRQPFHELGSGEKSYINIYNNLFFTNIKT